MIGLIILAVISCDVIIAFQEDRSFGNPLAISLCVISGVWIVILLRLGTLISNKIISRIDGLMISSVELSEGNTNIQIEVTDKEDKVSILNYNLEIVMNKIEKAAVFVTVTGDDNLKNEFDKSGDIDELGIALLSMTDQLKILAEEEKQRA